MDNWSWFDFLNIGVGVSCNCYHDYRSGNTNIRNIGEAVWGPQYSPRLLYWPRPIGPWSVWWPWGVLWPKYWLWDVSYFYYPTTFMLCGCNAITFIFWQEGSIATGILPTPNTSLSSLPVGSKTRDIGWIGLQPEMVLVAQCLTVCYYVPYMPIIVQAMNSKWNSKATLPELA